MTNRIRSRSSYFDGPPPGGNYEARLVSHIYGNGDWFSGYTGGFFQPRDAPYIIESIEDTVGGPFGSPKACIHSKLEITDLPLDPPTPNTPKFPYGNIGQYAWYEIRKTAPMGLNQTSIPDCNPGVDIAAERSSFFTDTVNSVTSEMPTQLSVPNFIFEARDILPSLASLGQLSEYGPKTFGSLSRAFETRRISLGKTAADHWLSYQFFIKPLWSDVSSALSLTAKVRKRVDYLRKTHGKSTKFRRSKSFGNSITEPYVHFSNYSNQGGKLYGRWNHRVTTTFSAGGRFRHELGGLDDVNREWSAIAASTGFDNWYKVAWDAIPFSFVADYFTNIGTLLGGLKSNDVYDGAITLENTWSQTKSFQESSYDVYFLDEYGNKSYQQASRGSKTTFSRQVGIPTSLGLVFNTRQTPAQIANIIALLAQ
jgi:hypothetical protein